MTFNQLCDLIFAYIPRGYEHAFFDYYLAPTGDSAPARASDSNYFAKLAPS